MNHGDRHLTQAWVKGPVPAIHLSERKQIFHSSLFTLHFQKNIGPNPAQLVVVMAVRKAVSAATTTFTAISTILFDFISELLNEFLFISTP